MTAPPPISIDLNCDLGESLGVEAIQRDRALAACVTSLNIACGEHGHAGDEATMQAMCRAARELGVSAGAHPGYPDHASFGRVRLSMTDAEIEESVRSQIGVLAAIAADEGTRLRHVKPHGALYHDAMIRPGVTAAIARAGAAVDPRLILVGMVGAPALDAWRAQGRRVLAEAFADRVYQPDGALRSRKLPGALISDLQAAALQAMAIARSRHVIAPGGAVIRLEADTLCVHADTPGALEIARAVRRALDNAGIVVRAPS